MSLIDDQRADVELLASANLSQEAIAGIIRNPTTGKSIAIETLVKMFKDELKNARRGFRRRF